MVLKHEELPGGTQTAPAARSVDLRKTYGTGLAAVHALAGVSVTFEHGRFTAVMGPSGSGKSTLMQCMAGLDRPTSGQTFVGGLDIGSLDDTGLTQLRRDRIGFVFQSFNLIPTLTAAAGTSAALARGELLIDSTTAKSKHLSVGDTLPVTFAQTGSSGLRIGGIYQANALIGNYLVSAGFFTSHFSRQPPAALLLRTNGSGTVNDAVTSALAAYPNVQVQTRAQFEQAQTASVNQVLGLVYALLALAVLIALIGIVNTLMLSVFERTREIGLLRAVGMKRRQVRTMIRSEAMILATFGAIIGIIIGTGMGIALVSSLKQQGITDTAVPISNLVIFLLLAALLGLVAASWPARRAARLDVLAAIAAQ